MSDILIVVFSAGTCYNCPVLVMSWLTRPKKNFLAISQDKVLLGKKLIISVVSCHISVLIIIASIIKIATHTYYVPDTIFKGVKYIS